MKIQVYLGGKVEVDVSPAQILEAIINLPKPERTDILLSGINCFANFMIEITDEQIASLTENQRKTIGDYLAQQSKRYLPTGQT